MVKQERLWQSSRGCGEAADYVCGYRGALKACSQAQTRSNRSRRAGSENSTAVAMEAAIYQLWWRQRFSGCDGDSDSAVVVETAIQR